MARFWKPSSGAPPRPLAHNDDPPHSELSPHSAAPRVVPPPLAAMTAAEQKLRQALLRAARLSYEVLPDGTTLQEWIEHWMADEVVLSTDGNGKANLQPRTPAVAVADFFASLPETSFTCEEDRLRKILLEFLPHGPVTLARVTSDRSVDAAREAVLPKYVELQDWIAGRIGAEIVVYDDDACGRMCALAEKLPDAVGIDVDDIDFAACSKLHMICKQLIGDSFGPGHILYNTLDVEGGFQTSVQTPSLPMGLGERTWYGDVRKNRKLARFSAAGYLVRDLLADPDVGPRIDADGLRDAQPHKGFAGLIKKQNGTFDVETRLEPLRTESYRAAGDQDVDACGDGPEMHEEEEEEGMEDAIDGHHVDSGANSKLHNICEQLVGSSYLKDHILFETCEVEGGFQTNVRTPSLPLELGDHTWHGEVCQNRKLAKLSAASHAVRYIIEKSDVSRSIDLSNFGSSQHDRPLSTGTKRRRREF